MKNLSIREGYQAFEKFFTDLVKFKGSLIVWQLDAEGKRQIHPSRIQEFAIDKGVMKVSEMEKQNFAFASDTVVYCYAESRGAIFKSRPIVLFGKEAQLKMPEELMFLEDDDVFRIKGVTGVDLSNAPWKVKRLGRSERDEAIFNQQLDSVSLSEEEKLFADKREAPRARPKVDKLITCQLAHHPETSQSFKLFDLSRGGLGFLILIEETFKRGQFVQVTALEGQDLDEPLIGEVMSVRSLAPEEVGWKVGVKFVDEIPPSEPSSSV